MFRYNSTTGLFEHYSGGAWKNWLDTTGGTLSGDLTLSGTLSAGTGFFVNLNGSTTLNGSVAVNADQTGATDAEPGVAVAITAACAVTPPKAVFFPAGVYLFNEDAYVPSGCNGLTLYAAVGTVTIRVGTANTSNPALFTATGNNYLEFSGLIFDGNSPASTNTHGLISINAPMIGFQFMDNQCINSGGNCLWAAGLNNVHTTILTAAQLGSFTGAISGTALTTSNVTIGEVSIGQVITSGALPGTTIVSGSGTSWVIDSGHSQTVAATPMTASVNYLNYASMPTGVVPGAYLEGEVDPDIYVTAINSPATGDVALSKPLTDTLGAGSGIQYTPAFTATSTQNVNDTSFLTSSTLNLVPNQTLQVAGGSSCMTPGTTISSIVTNTQVNFSPPLTCQIPSGTNIAAAGGFSHMRLERNRFENLGENLFTAGSQTYTTVGPQSSGSSTLTLGCYSWNYYPVVSGCASVGIIPGNLTAATGTPTGVPTSDLVLTQPVVDITDGNYQVTLKSPLTGNLGGATSTGSSIAGTTLTIGTVTSGTYAVGQVLTGPYLTKGTTILSNISGSGNGSTWTVSASQTVTNQPIASGMTIPFIVGQTAGNGYAMWLAYGAWFANSDIKIVHNVFRHTWSAALFLSDTFNALLEGNTYQMDYLETQLPSIAPSPCISPGGNINMKVVSEDCSGATGNGLEGDHNVGMQIIGGRFAYNMLNGIFLCSGHDDIIEGVHGYDNGQWINFPLTIRFNGSSKGAVNAGVSLGGTCTFARGGNLNNVTVSGVLTDDQPTPTQNYGINYYNGTLSNVVNAGISAAGNSVTNIDPKFGFPGPIIVTPYQDVQIFKTTGTWTVPVWCSTLGITCVTRLRLIAGGPGGSGGGQGTYGSAAVSGGATGGGGGCVDVTWPTAAFSSPVAVTVGSGGTGGAGGTSGAGSEGTLGTSTTFGSYAPAYTGGTGWAGQPSAQSYGGSSAGVAIAGNNATSSAAGPGNGAYGVQVGAAGGQGVINTYGTNSTAGNGSSLTSAFSGSAAPCIGGAGSGGTMLTGSVTNGGGGGAAIGVGPVSGAGQSGTTGTAGAGGNAVGSAGLYPVTAGPGGGGADSGGTGGAGGGPSVTGNPTYGCAGGGGGAGSVAGGAGGNGCPGYAVAVTNGG